MKLNYIWRAQLMKKVTLLFPNERELRRFTMISEATYLEMNMNTLKIVCVCSESDVNLAVKAFRAEIISLEVIQ